MRSCLSMEKVMIVVLVLCTQSVLAGIIQTKADVPKAALVEVEDTTGSDYAVIQGSFKPSKTFSQNAITLTIQADISRINRGVLNRIAQQWRGPVSVAILSASHAAIEEHFASKANDAVKQYAIVHSIVKKSWKNYPINRMRNFAIKGVQTDYFMVMDSDEDVVYPMSVHLDQVMKAKELFADTRSVFLVTSWQFSVANPPDEMPKDTMELVEWVNKGRASFKIPYYAPAYKCLDITEFQHLDTAVEVPYKDSFEPYFIARTGGVPLFDERFEGWGGDKNSLILRLALEDYNLVVLPKVFTWTREPYSAGMVHPPFADPALKPRVWHELGVQHGCDHCEPKRCVHQCPDLFKRHMNQKTKTGAAKVEPQSALTTDVAAPPATAPLATAPLVTAPLVTAPLATAPLATAPLATTEQLVASTPQQVVTKQQQQQQQSQVVAQPQDTPQLQVPAPSQVEVQPQSSKQ